MRRALPMLGAILALGAALPGGALVAAPPVYTVTLSPDYREVAGGTRIEFIATVYRYGQVDNGGGHDWDWVTEPQAGTFEGGSETPFNRNIWVAPFQPGTYLVKATTRRAQREGQWGVARIVVAASQPQPPACQHSLTLAPARCEMAPGAVALFQVNGCGHVNVSALRWQCGGAAHMGNGQVRAGSAPGNYELVVTDSSTGCRASATIVIAPPRPTHTCFMRLVPDRVQCQPGQYAAFQLQGCGCIDQRYVQWQCSGAVHEGGGRVRCGNQAGNYVMTVTESQHGFTCQATIEIAQPIVCQRIAITPDAGQCGPGEWVQFQATAYDNYGNAMNCALQWGCEGGVIQGNRWQAPAQPSRCRIWARDPQSGCTAQVWVEVRARGAYLVNIEPRVVRCPPGGSVSFSVRAYDEWNNAMQAGQLEWSCDGGVFQNGTWWPRSCAANRHYRITARDRVTGASDTVDVFVAGP